MPVYAQGDVSEIKLLPARPIEAPGKIYTYLQFLLVNEVNQGIHLFDNSDPANPVALGFIQVTGNIDVAVRNNVLYADHMGGLVSVATDAFKTFEVIDKLPLSNWLLGVPPPSNSYFECIDPDKGMVVAWKKQALSNPQCYAF